MVNNTALLFAKFDIHNHGLLTLFDIIFKLNLCFTF